MARKRKRSSNGTGDPEPPARRSTDHRPRQRAWDAFTPRHPVLQQYYPQILTLRAYLLSWLNNQPNRYRHRFDQVDASFAYFLDSTIIGSGRPSSKPVNRQARVDQFVSFTQQLTGSTAKSDVSLPTSGQNEIVDFVITLLFKHNSTPRPPQHLLCYGFQRAVPAGCAGLQLSAAPGIPGIQSFHPNQYVEIVKGPHWCRLLSLLGRIGNEFMIDLLMDCGIFEAVAGADNLSQICGTPLCNLKTLLDSSTSNATAKPSKPPHPRPDDFVDQHKQADRHIGQPTAIKFVRHRMLYARPSLNAKRSIRFGLSHIHVFNRYHDLYNNKQTQYIMHYIFPKQYGLHNVLTSEIDPKETTHAFKDYTLRETEISVKLQFQQERKNAISATPESDGIKCLRLPKRLQGKPLKLVATMRKAHIHCSYTELLQHHCPVPIKLDLQGHPDEFVKTNFLHAATPSSHVSAFCRAAIKKVVPLEFWGNGETAIHNLSRVLLHVDKFVRARKHETLTLHEVLEGLKIHDIKWLAPADISPRSKLSLTDFRKRKEIFMEFLYYVFDSFLIPLIRSNFYVTESNVNRNKLFYFRHDVWRTLAEPSLSQLKRTMFDEMETKEAIHILEKRPLPYSQVRWLPKQDGTRPIANLRRRLQRRHNGRLVLGSSINNIMKPVFNVIKFEKDAHEDNVGSSLFSVGDVLPKLRTFCNHLKSRQALGSPLYFAKVDVRSCFDTIPQRKVMDLMETLIASNDYRIARHAEIKPLFAGTATGKGIGYSNISRKFVSNGYNGDDFFDFQDMLSDGLSELRAKTVFVDFVVQSLETRDKILNLLSEHVERNIVKVGKRFFRQKNGIPQGSIISSLLCNLFYAQLEKEYLGFARGPDCLLLRMIDDFLIITTRQTKAKQFLQIMHDGIPRFGVSIKPEKTLANFPAEINGSPITELPRQAPFPYCGNLIDPTTLDLSKDRARTRNLGPISDTLTVDFARMPGRTFHRKALHALKIQMHEMYLDSSFNSLSTVLSNLYHNYAETAQKCFAYIKSLPAQKRPSLSVLIRTIKDVIALSCALMSRRGRRTGQWTQYQCAVSQRSARWLAYTAFGDVFGRKQTKYQLLLAWLAKGLAKTKLAANKAKSLHSTIVD
ncbi:MAG: hypothetical protein M1821_006363 [Bathelium mastoideum]|nr:MAG: hypothetical protein M1821_006363 [Bathelium mastoideum]